MPNSDSARKINPPVQGAVACPDVRRMSLRAPHALASPTIFYTAWAGRGRSGETGSDAETEFSFYRNGRELVYLQRSFLTMGVLVPNS
jgi:hypothetical protein